MNCKFEDRIKKVCTFWSSLSDAKRLIRANIKSFKGKFLKYISLKCFQKFIDSSLAVFHFLLNEWIISIKINCEIEGILKFWTF